MSAIGQILACPKCDSMVHIAPPPGWVVPASASSASQSSSALSVSSISLPAMIPTESATQQVPTIEATSAMSSKTSFSPIVLWGAGTAAIVLIGGLVGFVILRGGAAEKAVAPVIAMANPQADADLPANPPADEVATEPEVPADVPITDSTDSSIDNTVPANAEPAEPVVTETTSPATTTVATEEANPKSDDPTPTTTGTADAPKSDAAKTDSVSKDTAQTAVAPREPVLKFDPLDFDPSKLNLSTNTSSTNGANAVSDPATAAADKEAIGDKTAPDAGPLAGAPENPTVNVRLGPSTSDAPPPREIAKQLSLPVGGLDIAAVPLSRFIDILADMADLPITLDPVALETVGVSPREATKINVQNVTLDKLLRDTLEPRHLAFIERDGQLVITKPNSDRQRPVDYELKDLLAAGETDASAIGALIQKFVTPASWKAGGTGTIRVDGTKLHVEQADGVQYQILIFCERLRIARGLPTRSRYPVARLSTDTPYAKLAAPLSRETTFTFLPWTRLDDVTRQWQEASGVTVLVDWSALTNAELTPSTPLACSALNRSWSEAWDAILTPIGLGWRAVDGETIQITTLAALDEMQRVEFCAVPKPLRDQFASSDAMVESFTREVTDYFNANKNSPSPSQFEIVMDEPSGRLIVLGNASVQRFLSERLNGKL